MVSGCPVSLDQESFVCIKGRDIVVCKVETGEELEIFPNFIQQFYVENIFFQGLIRKGEAFVLKQNYNATFFNLIRHIKDGIKDITKDRGDYGTATWLRLDDYFPMTEIKEVRLFPVIGGVLLGIIRSEGGGGLTITDVLYIDCDQEEPVITHQQSFVAEALGMYADLTTLVHCHKVNTEGECVLVIQDFCPSEQSYIYQ